MLEWLFLDICDIVFVLADGSEILCESTLNTETLERMGYADVDGFVDLLSHRLIPSDLFELEFRVCRRGTADISELDRLFTGGGKVTWKQLS